MTINTNELVNILSQSPKELRVMTFNRLFLLMLLLFLLVTSIILGVRDNIDGLYTVYTAFQKTAILGCASLMSLSFINKAACPIERAIPKWSKITLPVIVMILAVIEIYLQPLSVIKAGLLSPSFVTCLIAVSSYGSLAIIASTWLMRKYAPFDVKNTGGIIGFAASTIAALGYSIHCPIDSIVFMIIAYGMPMMMLYLAGRFIIPRFIKW